MIALPPLPSLTAPHLEWMTYAACRDQDPDLFFPLSTLRASDPQTHEAKSICQDCVVVAICLRYALSTHQEAGIWGGQTEQERARLQRQRRPPRTM